MPSFSKVHAVEHDAQSMFDLVADVEKYPEFVPLCESLTIQSRRQRENLEILVADMAVGYRSIHQRFTSQVILKRAELVIDVQYLNGPFRHLDNRWRFEQTGSRACDVHFDIDYEFRSRSLGILMGTMFDRAFRRFTQAFEERADELYSK